MTYRDLLRRHGGTVAFGFCLAFLSAFGQTFFISLFGPDIRSAFGLSNGGFGAVYSSATLASGLLMIWAGGVIDRVSVPSYAIVALAGLGIAAFGLSVAPNVVALGLALFCLRLFGQGMLSHTAVTSTARLPQAIRGRAVSLAIMGFSTAEIVVPFIGIALIGAVGWAGTWRLSACVPLLAALAVTIGYVLQRRREPEMRATVPAAADDGFRRWHVLSDWRFLIFIPSMAAPAAINTGYFFHQRVLGEDQGWPLEVLALSVSTYAVAAVVSTIVTGWLVDRFGATVLCRGYLVPLCLASLVLVGAGSAAEAPLMFGLMGITASANGVVVPAVLAELFGTARLGTIRAMAGTINIIGSALTPVLFGWLLDAHLPVGALGIGCAVYVGIASLLNFPLHGSQRRDGLKAA